jgi:hypothetical protein
VGVFVRLLKLDQLIIAQLKEAGYELVDNREEVSHQIVSGGNKSLNARAAV